MAINEDNWYFNWSSHLDWVDKPNWGRFNEPLLIVSHEKSNRNCVLFFPWNKYYIWFALFLSKKWWIYMKERVGLLSIALCRKVKWLLCDKPTKRTVTFQKHTLSISACMTVYQILPRAFATLLMQCYDENSSRSRHSDKCNLSDGKLWITIKIHHRFKVKRLTS